MDASGPLAARCVTTPAAEAGVALLLALALAPVPYWVTRAVDAPTPLALAITAAVAACAAVASLRRPVWHSGTLAASGAGLRFLADAGTGPAEPLRALRVTDLGPVLLLSWVAADRPCRARLHACHHTPAAWSAWRLALGCRP